MLTVPSRHNEKLRKLLDAMHADEELVQLHRSANINAMDRAGINDHGEVHVQIVANAALRMLRLLEDAGVEPSVVVDHGLEADDAEVLVVLASALHDIGVAVHRDDHERYSLILAYVKARQLLGQVYDEPALTMLVCDTLHAILAHDADQRCLTLEAGVVKVADALDMTQGRSRIPFEAGSMSIHSVSAQAVASVSIEPGEERPISVIIKLSNSAGIFQVDELLKRKLSNSTLAPYVEVVASVEGDQERNLVGVYRL